jgi:glycine betaine/choline ABC-type transport system substrate-binding protein
MRLIVVKKLLLMIALLLIRLPEADACVGKTLFIGVVDSTEGRLFSEILSTIVNERTGTTVKTRCYRNTRDLYDAISAKQVDILIENTTTALQIIDKPADSDLQRTYETVKSIYEKNKGLVGKLAGTISDEVYSKLIKSVESGESAKKVARDFLKSRKLI